MRSEPVSNYSINGDVNHSLNLDTELSRAKEEVAHTKKVMLGLTIGTILFFPAAVVTIPLLIMKSKKLKVQTETANEAQKKVKTATQEVLNTNIKNDYKATLAGALERVSSITYKGEEIYNKSQKGSVSRLNELSSKLSKLSPEDDPQKIAENIIRTINSNHTSSDLVLDLIDYSGVISIIVSTERVTL